MVKWELCLKKDAEKDSIKLKQAGLKDKAERLLCIIEKNPFMTPPPYEKLLADLKGLYSRRLNRKHRIVYEIDQKNNLIIVFRMFTHYGE